VISGVISDIFRSKYLYFTRPRLWITVLNLLGSIGFMISALYALALPPGDSSDTFSWLSVFFTFQGGVCFFIGSYLLLPEMFSE